MYTTVQVRSEFGKFAYTAICMHNVQYAFLLVFMRKKRKYAAYLELCTCFSNN